MDPLIFVGVALSFTAFGYIWGRGQKPTRKNVEIIVGAVMDGLEKNGYLRTKLINGEMHYLKWPNDYDAKNL